MADYRDMHTAKLIHNIDVKENSYEAGQVTFIVWLGTRKLRICFRCPIQYPLHVPVI